MHWRSRDVDGLASYLVFYRVAHSHTPTRQDFVELGVKGRGSAGLKREGGDGDGGKGPLCGVPSTGMTVPASALLECLPPAPFSVNKSSLTYFPEVFW